MPRMAARDLPPGRSPPDRSDPIAPPAFAAAGVLDLQRAAGNRAVARVLARQPGATTTKTGVRVVRAGDTLHVVTTTGRFRNNFNGDFKVDRDGRLEFGVGKQAILVPIAGLTVEQTAQHLARCLVDQDLYVQPTVTVTLEGATATGSYKRPKTAADLDRERYTAYVADIDPADPALKVYKEYVEDPQHAYELTKTNPAQLWGRAHVDPHKLSPRAERLAVLNKFIDLQRADDSREKNPAERARRNETMTRFLEWVTNRMDAPGFHKLDFPKAYSDIYVSIIKREVKHEVAAAEERRKHPTDPATVEERSDKLKEFMDLADQLYALARRARQPHLKEFDKDRGILFLGDKVTAEIYEDLAKELLRWAFDHMREYGFTSRNAKAIFDEIRASGSFPERIRAAESAPEPHEYYDDRNKDVSAGGILEAFGKAVFRGLTVIAVVGAFVGAEIITGGEATVLLLAWAGKGGAESYIARRDEIERSGYDVPVLATVLVSAGDMAGVSEIIEGISGERLLTNVELSGAEREEAIGGGAGNMATMFMGSRAWKTGEAVGMRFREVEPSGMIAVAKPGPREKAARAQLPKELVVGFDFWMARIRATNDLDPEVVLKDKPIVAIEESSASFARAHGQAVVRGKEAAFAKAHPVFKVNEVGGEDVWMHYEKTPPSARQISHANQVARETGDTVHLFGDTGEATIGEPGRPLHLLEGTAGQARALAQDALANAKAAGQAMAEVYIDVPTATVAEIKLAWDAGAPELLGPVYEGKRVAKLRIRGRDGEWQPPTFSKKGGKAAEVPAAKRPAPPKKEGLPGEDDRVPVADKPAKKPGKEVGEEGPTGRKGKAPAAPKPAPDPKAERVAAEKERLIDEIREKRKTLTRIYTEIALLKKRQPRGVAKRAEIDAEKEALAREARGKVIPEMNTLLEALDKVEVTNYMRARAYSYSDEAEAAVIDRATIVDKVENRVKLVDEYSGKEIEDASIDHIVSIEEMSRMEGFDQLSPEDWKAVVSRVDNLRMMEIDLNSSKGSRRWEDWKTGRRIYGEKVWNEMVNLERILREDLAKDIKARAAKRPTALAPK